MCIVCTINLLLAIRSIHDLIRFISWCCHLKRWKSNSEVCVVRLKAAAAAGCWSGAKPITVCKDKDLIKCLIVFSKEQMKYLKKNWFKGRSHKLCHNYGYLCTVGNCVALKVKHTGLQGIVCQFYKILIRIRWLPLIGSETVHL